MSDRRPAERRPKRTAAVRRKAMGGGRRGGRRVQGVSGPAICRLSYARHCSMYHHTAAGMLRRHPQSGRAATPKSFTNGCRKDSSERGTGACWLCRPGRSSFSNSVRARISPWGSVSLGIGVGIFEAAGHFHGAENRLRLSWAVA